MRLESGALAAQHLCVTFRQQPRERRGLCKKRRAFGKILADRGDPIRALNGSPFAQLAPLDSARSVGTPVRSGKKNWIAIFHLLGLQRIGGSNLRSSSL
jgi:hypothetical protein